MADEPVSGRASTAGPICCWYAVAVVLGRQHRGEPPRRRRGIADGAHHLPLVGRAAAARPVRSQADRRRLGGDEGPPALHASDGRARVHLVQCLLLHRRPLHLGGQHRHHPGRPARPRLCLRLPDHRHTGRVRPIGRHDDDAGRCRRHRHQGRRAYPCSARSQRRRPDDARRLRRLCPLHRAVCRAGRRLPASPFSPGCRLPPS